MVKDFKKMYAGKLKILKCFQIIYFEKKLDVNDWKGDKIDEKSHDNTKSRYSFFDSFDKSTMCYDAALRIDPEDVYLLNKQGDNLSRLGHFDQAILCYDKALKIEPHNEYILNNKAIALLNSGKLDDALKVSDIALAINRTVQLFLYWRIYF